MIYFDSEKNAYGYEIQNPICTIEDSLWAEYAGTDKWDIIDGVFTDITNTPEYIAKHLEEAKLAKYNEALQGAKEYIDNEAVYQFDENNSIEATDGNIGKMTANAFGLAQGAIESVTWTSKEDNVLVLNAEDVARILLGLGAVQAAIWNVKFVAYKNAIISASTIEEVEAIDIDYSIGD